MNYDLEIILGLLLMLGLGGIVLAYIIAAIIEKLD